jgi:hypothetical protein
MGGGKRGVCVVHNAQHAQGASARVHGVVCGAQGAFWFFIPLPTARWTTMMKRRRRITRRMR